MLVFVAAIVAISLSHVNGQCKPRDDVIDVPVPDNVTGLFEGDIRFTQEQLDGFRRGAYNVLPITSNKRWGYSKPVVPYEIDSSYSQRDRQTITTALSRLSAATGGCVRFVPRTTHKNYLSVLKGGGCWSYIGRSGGKQSLSLGPGCVYTGVVQHEFLHALGFWHEQSRANRDNYVRIEWANINSRTCSNFAKTSWSYTQSYGYPYDYGSVMHYGSHAFSINRKPTIVPLKSNVRIGQRVGVSAIDVAQLKALYRCP